MKTDEDDVMIDTPYGRKRWGVIRTALHSYDAVLDALYRALPFVEDAEIDPAYQRDAVRAVFKQCRDALDRAEGKSKV